MQSEERGQTTRAIVLVIAGILSTLSVAELVRQPLGFYQGALFAKAMAAPSGPPPATFSSSPGQRFNVRDYRARGDGTTDDTAAIQATINAAPNGASAIYFPAGTYISNDFQVNYRTGLRFEGDGLTSIIKRPPLAGNTRIGTFTGASNITITNLAFDENGIQDFGGVNFYGVRNVLIENTRHFDSNPQPIPTRNWRDHFSYIFAQGGSPSEDITVRNNIIEYLDLQFVFARRVTVIDNRITTGCCTSGIGFFSLSNGTFAEDIVVERNTVIDPRGSSIGIVVELDPPSTNNGSFRRIRIANNIIIRLTTNGNGILIGTANNSVTTTGNVFEDISIADNRFRVEPNAPPLPADAAAIKANNRSTTANILFNHFTITGNIMTGVRYGMDLRFIQNSTISGNDIRGASTGIAIADRMRGNRVSDNLVESNGISYFLAFSGGNNTFVRNRYAGRSSAPLQVQEIAGSDVIAQPVYAASPPPQP